MMSTSVDGGGFRQSVVEAKQRWREGRAAIRQQHDDGGGGFAVCTALSDLQDAVILQLYERALEDLGPNLGDRLALVLLGGSGRQDIAPFSDVDLMMLYDGQLSDEIKAFARRINEDVTDAGMQLGFSLRTARDACSMALQDAFVFSSLTESRRLVGNPTIYDNAMERFRRLASRRPVQNIKAVIAARDKERAEYGETVYLLRPNVKRTRGGLRDIHLIRWLGYIRYGVTDLNELLKRGGLSTADTKQLKKSQEFLLRLRNEMHFHAGGPNDGLGRNEQVRLASSMNYPESEAMMAVEAFMREYFRYTSRIGYISDHFVSKSTAKTKKPAATLLAPLVNRHIDEHFVMNATEIGVIKNSRKIVRNDLEQVLRLMQLACLYDKSIEHETWISIRHAMLKFPDVEFSHETARRFMALLSNTKGLDELLRRLHEMQVLQKILPDFSHARGLLQFNEYHKYTVDEHSLRAVGHLIEFENDATTVGKTYRRIREKDVLHLAMLLHDLGKGYPEDHSEVGRRIAEETGKRFGLPAETTKTITFLVHKHLLMSHVAFHRDANDPQTVAEFASTVGSPETLAMLYVLTCADIAAVGPGVLNPWKLSLLTELYRRTKKVLTGNSQQDLDAAEYESVHAAIDLLTEEDEVRRWLKKAAAQLPANYLRFHQSSQIAQQLLDIRNRTEPVYCQPGQIEGVKLNEICIAVADKPGLFCQLSGQLSGLNLRITSADMNRLDASTMFFWFQFVDKDFPDKEHLPEFRMGEIRQKTIEALTGEARPPRFRKVWGEEETLALQLSRPEISVNVNNTEVDTATIVDVFAYDKAGLLYRIAKKLFELGLDVSYACISTYAHQVIDVFYVTDEHGNKVRSVERLEQIQNQVFETVKNFLEPDDSVGGNP